MVSSNPIATRAVARKGKKVVLNLRRFDQVNKMQIKLGKHRELGLNHGSMSQ